MSLISSKKYSTENIVLNLLKNSNLWVDFSDTTKYTVSSPNNTFNLLSVTDKSNDARAITIPTGPTIDTANKCMIGLTGGGYLQATIGGATALSDTETIIMVISQSDNTNTNGSFVGTATTGARCVRNGTNFGYNALGSSDIATINTLPVSTVMIVSIVTSVGNAKIYYNGILHGSGDVNFTVNATLTRIGQTNSTFYNRGNLFEIIFFNTAVPDDQRQLIERYLAQKWKIVSTISTPLSVTGCTLWLDGNDSSSITYSSGTNISKWNDKSGNNYHAVQNTAARQPTYDSTAKAVNFVAASIQFMTTTSPYTGSNNSESIYIVFQTNGTVTNADLIGTTDTARGRQIRIATKQVQIYNGVTLSVSGARNNLTTTDKFLLEFLNYDPYFMQVNINKAVDIIQGRISFATGTWNQVIGGTTLSGAVPYDGKIYEVVIFNRILTPSERTSIQNYLYTKWNIDPGPTLFSNQPYASIPPYLRYSAPFDVSGLSLWLDAADRSTLTLSGPNVTQWNDKSGNLRHATQATAARQPTWANNAITFVSANQKYLSLPDGSLWVGNASSSHFIVFSYTNAANTGSILLNQGVTTGNLTIKLFTNGNILYDTWAASPLQNFGTLTINTTYIVSYTFNLPESLISPYINGTIGTTRAQGSFTVSGTNATIGAEVSGSRYGDCIIKEIIAFNKFINKTEQQLIEGYLAQKWGLTTNLGSTHIFKNELSLTPAFDPRKFPLILWLDASDTKTVILSGSSVIQWNDKSGTNNFLSNGAPVYTTTPSGKRAVYFSSNNLQLYSSSNSSTTANASRSIFIVAQAPNGGSSIVRLGAGTHAVNTTPSAFGFDINPPVSLVYAPYVYAATDNQFNVSVTTLSTFYAYSDGTNIGGSYNFGTVQSKARTLNTTATPWYMGLRDDGKGCIDSYICEFLHFNDTLNTFQRQQIEGYLAWKWGIQSTLPSGHPYIKNPPY